MPFVLYISMTMDIVALIQMTRAHNSGKSRIERGVPLNVALCRRLGQTVVKVDHKGEKYSFTSSLEFLT